MASTNPEASGAVGADAAASALDDSGMAHVLIGEPVCSPDQVRARLSAEQALELDRSRPFASVHGEPEIAQLGFIQDGIPFTVAGRLHTAALKRPEFKDAGEAVQRKLRRIKAEHAEAVKHPADDTANRVNPTVKLDDDPDADVNLVAWAKGQARLQPHVVYRVARKRFGKHFHTLAEVAAHLVSEKLVEPGELKV